MHHVSIKLFSLLLTLILLISMKDTFLILWFQYKRSTYPFLGPGSTHGIAIFQLNTWRKRLHGDWRPVKFIVKGIPFWPRYIHWRVYKQQCRAGISQIGEFRGAINTLFRPPLPIKTRRKVKWKQAVLLQRWWHLSQLNNSWTTSKMFSFLKYLLQCGHRIAEKKPKLKLNQEGTANLPGP